MAEILIQQRRHRSVWPWLIGLATVALLPLPFMAADRDDRRLTRVVATRPDTQMLRDTTPALDTTAQPVAGEGAPNEPAAAAAGNRTAATAGGAVVPAESASATGRPPVAASVRAASAAPATTFDRFITSENRNANEHEYVSFTAEGLRRLAEELRTLGASEAGVRAILANADSLERISPRRRGHADYARAAFLAAVREFDVLRGRHSVPVDTGRMRAAIWAIRPERPLQEQRATVRAFFETARNAVLALPRSTGTRRRR